MQINNNNKLLFIWSCLNIHNLTVWNILMAAKISLFLSFNDNYRLSKL